ncbi:FAD-dependent monooxygenase, partial [Synechococcus sp. AH-551-B05]
MRILIVGAGPVGLMFCARLSKDGHECILIEKNHLRHTLSRASSLQPASLECLDEFGFLPRLIAQGQRIDELMSWDLDHDLKNTCSYDLIRDETLYPFRLHVNQSILRDQLIQFLQECSSCTILDQAEVTSVISNSSDHGVSVRVKLRGSSDLVQILHGDFLVISDGANSILRSQLGLRFDGYDLPAPVVRFSVDSIPKSLHEELAGVSYLKHSKLSVSCLKMLDGWRFILRPRVSELSEAL